MVLLSFIGIGLGIYGLKQIAEEPIQYAREKHIKNNRADADIDIICQYIGIKKKNGLYPSDTFNRIKGIMQRQFYFTDNEIDKLRKQYNQVMTNNQKQYDDNINNKYNKILQSIIQKGVSNQDDYYTIRHWHFLSKEQHQKRLDKIANDKIWKRITLEPPMLIDDNKTNGYIEVWHIKKPYGYFKVDECYKTICTKLGY